MSDYRISDSKSVYSWDKLSTKYSEVSVLSFDNYAFKLLCFRSKIKATLKNIKDLLTNGIIEPNGEEECDRRRRRCKEFSIRFSRNFTYQINRNVNNLRQFEELEANKVSPNFMRISVYLHHLSVQALDKFCLQLPNMLASDSLPDYFVETLKFICEMCVICCGVEVDTNGDCKLIEYLNDIEKNCKTMIVNKIPIFYQKETVNEKRKRGIPAKPKNMLEMYTKKAPLRKTQSIMKKIKGYRVPSIQLKRNYMTNSTTTKNSALSINRSNFGQISRKLCNSIEDQSQILELPTRKKPAIIKEAIWQKGCDSGIETILDAMKNKHEKKLEKQSKEKSKNSKYFISEVLTNRYDLSECGNDNAKLISIKIRNDFDKRKLENFLSMEKKTSLIRNREEFHSKCKRTNAYFQMGPTNAWSILSKISDLLVNDLLDLIMQELESIIDQNITDMLLAEVR